MADWLDSSGFYDACQAYRYESDQIMVASRLAALKSFIRVQMAEVDAIKRRQPNTQGKLLSTGNEQSG